MVDGGIWGRIGRGRGGVEGVVAGVLRTVIGRGGIAVCPGVSIISWTRGSGGVKGWGRVGGRVVGTGVEGMISRWIGTTEEGGFGHPAMVDG